MIGKSVYAAEDISTEQVTFSIPANSFCDRSHEIQLSLNITNVNTTDATIILNLYDRSGKPLNIKDEEYNGINSDIELGTNKVLTSNNTAFYQVNFGSMNNDCSNRPYYGTIKAIGNETSLIASGWITASNGNTPIIIKSGDIFHISGSKVIEPQPQPQAVPVASKEVCTNPQSDIILSASSSYSSEFLPCQAFDGDIYSSWATKVNTTTGWLQIDFKKAYVVNKYTITARTKSIDGIGYTPKDWTIQASNNGTDWTILDNQTNQDNWSYGEMRTYKFNNTNSYRYYRLDITKNNGVTYYTAIGEISFSN